MRKEDVPLSWREGSLAQDSAGPVASADKDSQEAQRLTELDYLQAVRPEADHVLQELVDEVRVAFGTGLCMVNLVLADVQYFRAWSGDLPDSLAEARQDPRERSMCQYVIESGAPFFVEDFLKSEEFRDQHFCVNYGIRFYAGTPLVTSNGHAIGTLCLLDNRPRRFGEEQMTLLAAFARSVTGRLELLGALGRERAAREEVERLSETLEAKVVDRTAQLEVAVVEARHNERMLGRSEARHRAVVETASDAIVTVRTDGIIRSFNRAAELIFGYKTEEAIGQPLSMLMPERLRAPHEAGFRRYLKTNEARVMGHTVELTGLRKGGEEFPLELSLGEAREGDDVLFTGIIRDITERKKAEEAL
ncbi:MAG TPA: PAS domain S-box protein, partial [Rubrobacteraceae bacterium]|nr:PAS domain S-box protein [Rubrobacteraceae bacterium]